MARTPTEPLRPRLGGGGSTRRLALLALLVCTAVPVRSGAYATPAAPAPVGFPDHQPDFQWRRVLPRGGTLQVKGVVGNIRVVPAPGEEARVTADREGGEATRSLVDFQVVDEGARTTICAVYRGSGGTGCAAGRELGRPAGPGAPSVDFTIEVPATVDLLVGTRTGDIVVEGVAGNVEAYGVTGDIRVNAGGAVQAETITGSIHASIGRMDWSGERSFRTVTGNLMLELPDEPSTTVRALAALGEVSSVFPLSDNRLPAGRVYRYPYRADGVLGHGGRGLVLEVARGSIYLGRRGDGQNQPLAADIRRAPRGGTPSVSSPAAVRMSMATARSLVRHRDPEVRGRAVIALQDLGGAESATLLRDVLLRDAEPSVRQRAAFSLGQVGQKAAVPDLIAALASDPDPSVRQAAAYSLGVLSDPRAEASLLRAADDQDSRVSQTAVWALGELNR